MPGRSKRPRRDGEIESVEAAAQLAALEMMQDPAYLEELERRWQDPEYRARMEAAYARSQAAEQRRNTPAWKAERVLAAWEMVASLRRLLVTAAAENAASAEDQEELAWFDRKLATHHGRAEPPWHLLEAYRVLFGSSDRSDGATLRESWDSFAGIGGALRRSWEGGAVSGHGRRLTPLARIALARAVEPVEKVLRLIRAVEKRDGPALLEVLSYAFSVERAAGREPTPRGAHTALVRWAAEHLWMAAVRVDPRFGEARIGRDGLAAFRAPWKAGAESHEWTMAVANAIGDPDVHAALDAGKLRRETEKKSARGGPRVAAAIVVEHVTGVSASKVAALARHNSRPSS